MVRYSCIGPYTLKSVKLVWKHCLNYANDSLLSFFDYASVLPRCFPRMFQNVCFDLILKGKKDVLAQT